MSSPHQPQRRTPPSAEPAARVERPAAPPLQPVEPVESAQTPARRRRIWPFIALGVGISLLLAAVVSFYASSAPDGLNKVAEDLGFGRHAQDSATADSPVADYEAAWIADDRLAVAVAGIAGVLLTGALAFSLFLWLGRRNPVDPDEDGFDTADDAHDPSGPTPR